MEAFLSSLGWMSIQAGFVTIVVLVVRFLFGKLRVPKKYVMLLWMVPYLCMICPWKIESDYGFWRQPGEYRQDWVYSVLQELEVIVGGSENGESEITEALEADGVMKDTTDLAEQAKGAGYGQNSVKLTENGHGLQMSEHSEGWLQTEQVEDWQNVGNPENWLASDMQNNEASQGTTHMVGERADDTGALAAVDGFEDTTGENVNNSFRSAEMVTSIVFAIWLTGVLGIVIYSVISYVRLKRKLLCSVKLRENIYIADDIQAPFVLGILCPKIYLPSGMSKENQLYVLAHENTHIRRRDSLWKPATLLITAVHWFNPLAWLAMYFMEKDMEMACDEETVLRLGLEQKQAYATALLQMSAGRKFVLEAPLAFGEGNVKDRIQNIVKYKKTLGIISVLAIVLVGALTVVFMSTASTCELQNVEEEWSVFHATEEKVSVVMNGERTEFSAAYCTEFSEFFLELEVVKAPISKSRDEDRVKDIVISFEEERFYYLSADCTEIWSDNRVKPGYSYQIQNPQEVKDFLEKMLGSVTVAEAEASGQGEDKQQDGQENADKAEQGRDENIGSNVDLWSGAVQVTIQKPLITKDTHEGAAGVFLDYASEERIVFHDYYGLFVYDKEKGLIGEIDLNAIGMEMIQGSNAWYVQVTADGSRIYMHGMEDENMYVYDVELNQLYLCERYDVSGINMFRGLLDTQACVEWDYTVARSWHCVKVGEDSYHYLESGSGLPIDFCWMVEKEQTDIADRECIRIFEEHGENAASIEQPSSKLPAFTMEDLISLCKEEKVGETMQNYVWQDGLLPENFEKQQGVEGALTYTYSCVLSFGDKEYRFSASYWKTELAQEYGHAPDQLDMVHLRDIATDDLLLLYSEEPRYTVNLDIEEFLSREYDIEKYMIFNLPEETYLGDYSVSMQDIFEGSLILGDFEEIQHGEWAPWGWYAPGGVGVTDWKMLEELATFEDGRLAEFHWYGNHMWGEKVEVLENCDLPAVLYHYNFDLFTLPELDEYAKKNNISMDEVDAVSDYWYVFFAEPKGEHVYTAFLNQAYFSKEDIVKLAESVRFK